MSEIEKLIEEVLKKEDPNEDFKDTRETLIEALSIYHEELKFQNDELKETNQYLEEVKLEYERLFMDAPVGYLIVDREGVITKANHYSYQLFDSLVLHQSKLQHMIADEDQDHFYFFFQQLNGNQLETDFSFKTRTKPIRYIKLVQQYVRSNETLIHLAIIDETALVTYQNKIQYMSNHDALTGAYNRHYYEGLIQRLNPTLTQHFGVIFADINGLKMINDAFGHAFGDELIKKTAELINQYLDDSMHFARIGGDEFVIILTNTTEEQMKQFMLQLQEAQQSVSIKDIQLSISFGYAYKRKKN
ncbi:MAG: GGDEF domain-containing protein, partial [Bacillota bacterium]